MERVTPYFTPNNYTMDQAFTRKVQEFLAQPIGERNLEEGATLLLQMTSNRALQRYVLRGRDQKRLDAELTKYLRIRLDGLTRAQVYLLEAEVMPRVRETYEQASKHYAPRPADFSLRLSPRKTDLRGKRADHDYLPKEVRALYDQNGDIFRRMRQTFETLKGMQAATACDRYEYVKILADLDTRYRDNLKRYDAAPAPTKEERAAIDRAEAQAAAAADLGQKGSQEAVVEKLLKGEEV